MPSGTQVCRCPSRMIASNFSSALRTACVWRRMSMQYLSSSTILRMPAMCPSMYERRFSTSGFRSSCIFFPPFVSLLALSSKPPQAQRIAHHSYRRNCHSSRRKDRGTLTQERNQGRENGGRYQDHVVGKSPEEILLDGAHRRPREG